MRALGARPGTRLPRLLPPPLHLLVDSSTSGAEAGCTHRPPTQVGYMCQLGPSFLAVVSSDVCHPFDRDGKLQTQAPPNLIRCQMTLWKYQSASIPPLHSLLHKVAPTLTRKGFSRALSSHGCVPAAVGGSWAER